MPAAPSSPFHNRNYLRLFSAQVTSLVGTGLTTIALALLAWDLAGDKAAQVLGTALALKMVVYVFGAPVLSAVATRVPMRAWLIAQDLIRAGLVICLPFVSAVWQIYVLVVLINFAAASFTPVFQAAIPVVLNDEDQYRRALSYAQIAYALEQIASPAIAAALLTIMSFDNLFQLNFITFLVSATLLAGTTLPQRDRLPRESESLTFGIRAYLRTPRLQATLAMYVGVAAASAMVLVNTVIYVLDVLGLDESALALTMAALGCGSIAGALLVPRLLQRVSIRGVMLTGIATLAVMLLLAATGPTWSGVLILWLFIGAGLAMVQTPVGSLVRMSAHDRDSPSLFAANFSLSHLCWLLAYPTAGVLGTEFGLNVTFGIMGLVALVAAAIGAQRFPNPDLEEIEHTHENVQHAHAFDHDEMHAPRDGGEVHRHAKLTHTHRYVIDEHHPFWA